MEMIVNQCALIFRSSWFLVCRGCSTQGSAVRSLLFGVVMVLLLFLTFSCPERGAGVSRSLLLSVLSLVMVVLMMLQMFFMSAKM